MYRDHAPLSRMVDPGRQSPHPLEAVNVVESRLITDEDRTAIPAIGAVDRPSRGVYTLRIFEDYVSVLPARVVGQPCGAWDGIIGQWTAEVMAAHASFDAAESHWAFPSYAGPLDW